MSECSTCGADPCANPSFCAVCRKADQDRAAGKPPTQAGGHWWPNPEVLERARRRLNPVSLVMQRRTAAERK